MATTKEMINSGLCALQDVLGTDISKGCVSQIQAAKSIWAIAPGESFRAGEDFESEKTRLILASKLVILNKVNTFEENGSDDAVETLADDTMGVTNEGKYKFLATFTNGVYFNKALHSIKGFRNWNIMIVDGKGVWGTKTTLGGLTGFTTGMIQPAKLQTGTNAAIQKEGLGFQFTDRTELDVDFGFIVDSTARKQKGVTQIELSFVNAPKASDAVVTVKAVLAQDKAIAFTGIGFANFLIGKNATSSAPTGGADTTIPGTYPLATTAISVNDQITVKLFSENTSVIVGPDGDYYKSNLLSATAIA